MAGGEQRPAVAAALGDVEVFARAQHVQYGQVVDATLRALRKAEARQGTTYEVAVLHAHQVALLIIIRYLQPRHTLPVAPRSQPAPSDYPGIEPAFIVEKPARLVVQPRMFEVFFKAFRVEGGLRGEG